MAVEVLDQEQAPTVEVVAASRSNMRDESSRPCTSTSGRPCGSPRSAQWSFDAVGVEWSALGELLRQPACRASITPRQRSGSLLYGA